MWDADRVICTSVFDESFGKDGNVLKLSLRTRNCFEDPNLNKYENCTDSFLRINIFKGVL